MTLTFENEQDFDLGFDPEEVAAAVINGVLDQEACPYEAEVELILTDPENIRTMNREHRNIDRETDGRLSFSGFVRFSGDGRGR